MAMTKAQAQEHLDAWLAADKALATGQSYSIGNRTLSRENAQEVRNQIQYWEGRVRELATVAAGGRPGVLTPRFR